jgi:hypothetical protein
METTLFHHDVRCVAVTLVKTLTMAMATTFHVLASGESEKCKQGREGVVREYLLHVLRSSFQKNNRTIMSECTIL